MNATKIATRARRHIVLLAILLAVIITAALTWGWLVAWFTGGRVGGDGRASTGVVAQAGALAIAASIEPDPPRQKGNTLHLAITGEGEAPIEGAEVRVDAVMPAMGAMPEMRATADVGDRGGGRYQAGFDLAMGGSWTLEVHVKSAAGSGTARFSMTVDSPGLRSLGASGRAAGPAEPQPPALPAREFPAPALAALQNAFTAYEEIRAALARDHLESALPPARAMVEQIAAASSALAGEASELTDCLDQAVSAGEKLIAAGSLDDARTQFGEVSSFLIALGMSDARLQAGWHLFRCPMAKGFRKWFQRSPEIENPYMGPEMLTCGSKESWTPPAPPSGNLSHEGHGHAGDDVAFYTCSMDSIRQRKPGKCPICSMDLAPVTYDESESGVVRVDQARRKRIGLTTRPVTRAPMTISIRAVGRLTYDETRIKDVTLKVKGWIAKLQVSATGQPVKKGETLLTLYSPELYAAQQEYILALASQKAAAATGAPDRSDYLVKAAEKKLRLWDLTPSQLTAIARRGEPIEELPILAPASGYVIEKDAIEGAAVEPGQRLYRIAALDRVWIEAQVYEMDLPQVKKGQKAKIALPYQPGEALEGTVAFVYPYLDPTSRTGRVRIEVSNKDLGFKPDMYANVELEVDLGPRLQIPIEAVVYTGPRRLVFVDVGEDRIQPQEVTLGARSADLVEVKAGLSEGQLIVTSGNFLIAAESRIRSAAQFWANQPARAPDPPAAQESGHGAH